MIKDTKFLMESETSEGAEKIGFRTQGVRLTLEQLGGIVPTH